MSKTVKNFILILTPVLAVVFIVFVVNLILINGNGGSEAQTASPPSANRTPSAASPPASENTSGETPAASLPAGSPSPGSPETPSTRPPQPGERQELAYTRDYNLILYTDPEQFERIPEREEELFVFTGSETEGGTAATASLEVCFIALPRGAAVYAEDFLDGYLDGGETQPGGERQIGFSGMTGVYVSGVNNGSGETFEAWIHQIPDEDIGLAFVVRYSTDAQKNALYTVVDSIEPVPTENP